jgi:hypothetical protein
VVRALTEALRSAARAARERPSFALYLGAIALFPFNWLSPFSYGQAGWTDILVAAATAAWLVEKLPNVGDLRLRPPHYAYAAYLACGVLSMLLISGTSPTSVRNVLTMFELVALALLTADFARERAGRRAIARVVLAVTAVTALQALIGLALFYAGDSTTLVDAGSAYLGRSDVYTRIDGGFYGPALLGSFCIFASAILALPEADLSPRVRLAGQIVLAALCVLTLSRAVIGFALAVALRAAYSNPGAAARRFASACAVLALLLTAFLTVAPLSVDPVRPESSRSDINPRLATFRTSAETVADHPLFGKGPGTLTGRWEGGPLRAHFTPLNVAATIGIPAVVALIALVLILWRQRRRPTNIVIWSGLAGLAVDALGQDAEHFRHVWIMLGFADADRQS